WHGERGTKVGGVLPLGRDEAPERERERTEEPPRPPAADGMQVGEHADARRGRNQNPLERRGIERWREGIEEPEGMESADLRVGVRRIAAEHPWIPAAEPPRPLPPPRIVRHEEGREVAGRVLEAAKALDHDASRRSGDDHGGVEKYLP